MKAPKEWLTYDIAISYRDRARRYGEPTLKEKKKLMEELRNRCGVTELEATCILRGANIIDYVRKYEILKDQYKDILINGEPPKKEKKIRCKYKRPEYDPNQITLASGQ